jgi:hypothetical protein
MYDAGKIVAGLVIFFGLISFPVWVSAANGDVDYVPELNLPADETSCIESTEYMRANHMYMLLQWREEVVRNGERIYIASDGQEYIKSLTDTCLECHSPKAEFCDQCHNYVDAEPDCWNCHNDPEGSQ